MKVGFMSKVPFEAPSLCSFDFTYHLKIKLKSDDLFILHKRKRLVSFYQVGIHRGCPESSPRRASVPACTAALSSPEIYRQSSFADSLLSGLITSTPNCPGPSSFPPVIYFLPQRQRSSTGLPFWLWRSFSTLKGNRKKERGGWKKGNEVNIH